MSTSNDCPRKFWQIHLSTAILSMLLASALLGLNLVQRDTRDKRAVPTREYEVLKTWGWPCKLGKCGITKPDYGYADDECPTDFAKMDMDDQRRVHFFWIASPAWRLNTINAASCVLLVLVFGVLCEIFVRRKLR